MLWNQFLFWGQVPQNTERLAMIGKVLYMTHSLSATQPTFSMYCKKQLKKQKRRVAAFIALVNPECAAWGKAPRSRTRKQWIDCPVLCKHGWQCSTLISRCLYLLFECFWQISCIGKMSFVMACCTDHQQPQQLGVAPSGERLRRKGRHGVICK